MSSEAKSRRALDRVRAAAVRLPRLGGQGVLVRGGYLLTAAHCVGWSAEGGMALGDFCLEPVETAGGRTFLASVVAVEPVADVAVLGPADGQCGETLADAQMAFDAFTEDVDGVPILSRVPELGAPLAVQVLNRKREWVAGTVTRYGLHDATLGLEASAPIMGGDSGSPVVDAEGRLVGVISWSGGPATEGADDGGREGAVPFAWLALPRWLSDRISCRRRRARA
jgi:S1-C subfamily serine protease